MGEGEVLKTYFGQYVFVVPHSMLSEIFRFGQFNFAYWASARYNHRNVRLSFEQRTVSLIKLIDIGYIDFNIVVKL